MDTNSKYYSVDRLPVMMTVGELSTLLRVSKATAYALIHNGSIPYIKAGRQIRIYREDALCFCGKNGYL